MGNKLFVGGSFGFKIIDVNSGSIRNCNVNSQLRYSYGTASDAGAIFLTEVTEFTDFH